jgi:hypothetical protein
MRMSSSLLFGLGGDTKANRVDSDAPIHHGGCSQRVCNGIPTSVEWRYLQRNQTRKSRWALTLPTFALELTLHQLDQVVIGLLSSDRSTQLAATKQYRQLIYTENPSIPLDPSVYDRGILRRLVEFLQYDHHPKLQASREKPLNFTLTNAGAGLVSYSLGVHQYHSWSFGSSAGSG